jgi:hypothetical protein
MKASVVTFAQLPDEEPAFLAFLAKTGDVWARAVADDAAYDPAPVAEFIHAHAERLTSNGTMDVYLGFRPDVLDPARREDGTVDIFGARLIDYRRGGYYPGGELAQSNLFFYRGSFVGDEFVTKPEAFLKWARKVLGWARRHSPERVPVYRCNYKTRATARVAEAAAGGLKVWY